MLLLLLLLWKNTLLLLVLLDGFLHEWLLLLLRLAIDLHLLARDQRSAHERMTMQSINQQPRESIRQSINNLHKRFLEPWDRCV